MKVNFWRAASWHPLLLICLSTLLGPQLNSTKGSGGFPSSEETLQNVIKWHRKWWPGENCCYKEACTLVLCTSQGCLYCDPAFIVITQSLCMHYMYSDIYKHLLYLTCLWTVKSERQSDIEVQPVNTCLHTHMSQLHTQKHCLASIHINTQHSQKAARCCFSSPTDQNGSPQVENTCIHKHILDHSDGRSEFSWSLHMLVSRYTRCGVSPSCSCCWYIHLLSYFSASPSWSSLAFTHFY